MVAWKLTYDVGSNKRAFQVCGISPLNSRTFLGEPSRNITRQSCLPLYPSNPPLPMARDRLSGLGGILGALQIRNLPSTSVLKVRLKKSPSLGRSNIEPDTEAPGHKLLQSQVLDKLRKTVQDCRVIIRARLLGSTDIARLRAE